MFAKRFALFRLLGFEVSVDPSWIILAVLITWSLAAALFPGLYPELGRATYWAMGVAGLFGLVLSIVLHELAHSVVARRYGMPIRGITLFIFGGVAEMEDEPVGPKAEFRMAIVGPSASLFVAAKLAHMSHLPQGQPERYERARRMVVAMDEAGFGSCSNHYECEAVCPKEIPVDFIARMNRDYAKAKIAKR